MKRQIKRSQSRGLIILAIFLFCAAPSLFAQTERITNYETRITVNSDASLTVVEKISVQSAGDKIRHGIYRDFPTTYRTSLGDRTIRGFDVLGVTRDGLEEIYRVENQIGSKRVYIGSKDVELPPGNYTYTITYTTTRQIGFFSNFDELYWNVTGNEWDFPIDRASATIILPGEASHHIISTAGYTGLKGETGKAFDVEKNNLGEIFFRTTVPLDLNEGLTVAVSWPKGYVVEPSGADEALYFFSDNLGTIVLIFGIIVVLLYYLIVWKQFGKDPEKGTIIPRYTPPNDIPPAAMRFIARMGFDHKTFAAAIINLAVRGYLKIEEEKNSFKLKRINPDAAGLSPAEQSLGSMLFQYDGDLELKQSNNTIIAGAIKSFKKSLSKSYEMFYFITNRRYFFPGVGLSAIILIAAIIIGGSAGLDIFSLSWLGGWGTAVGVMLTRVISSWRVVLKTGFRGMAHATIVWTSTIILLPFLGGLILGFAILGSASSFTMIVMVVALVFINYLFYRLLKAPTRAGRKLMDVVEGFKMYLSVAEKDELKTANLPEKTSELYERYLPYALALDVENEWSEKFSDVLSRIGEGQTSGYSPSWYSGSHWSTFGAAGFAAAFGGALASSVSSSSGSSGGGSSGGGGGGGGGGGW
jgi:uncharacterized membrane protein